MGVVPSLGRGLKLRGARSVPVLYFPNLATIIDSRGMLALNAHAHALRTYYVIKHIPRYGNNSMY